MEIAVLSFNIRCDMGYDGANNWAHRAHLVHGVIRQQCPDFVACQEVLPNQRRDLETNLPQFQWLGRGRQPGGYGEQCAIGVPREATVMESGTFWLSERPEQEASVGWDACLPRICTWAQVEHQGRELLFANTHFDHIGERAKCESGKLLLSTLAVGEVPTVVVGDLNCLPGSEPIATLSSVWRDVHSNQPPVPTYHEFGAICDGPKIDYIFVSEQFEIVSAEVLTEEPPHSSDHFPVASRLRLGPGTPGLA